jgi:hypothetical protein
MGQKRPKYRKYLYYSTGYAIIGSVKKFYTNLWIFCGKKNVKYRDKL